MKQEKTKFEQIMQKKRDALKNEQKNVYVAKQSELPAEPVVIKGAGFKVVDQPIKPVFNKISDARLKKFINLQL